jgi:LysM repeat protein
MRTFRFFAPRVLLAAFVFALGALLAPAAAHAAGPSTGGFFYTVQYGDSLESIAARYGVSVQAILQANGMYAPNMFVGRQVYMPAGYPSSGGYGTSANRVTVAYVVQPGDTLFGIAQRFGVSAFTLARLNNLFNPNFIFAGMRLIVPRAAPAPTYQTYLVRFGDSLSGIALRFGTSVYALMVANNIPNPNLIFAGMRLVLPIYSTNGYTPPSNGYPPANGYPTPAVTATAPGPGTTTAAVSLMNIAYNPKSITVHVGTKVTWTNNDSGIPHTVTSGVPGAPSGAFDSGT